MTQVDGTLIIGALQAMQRDMTEMRRDMKELRAFITEVAGHIPSLSGGITRHEISLSDLNLRVSRIERRLDMEAGE